MKEIPSSVKIGPYRYAVKTMDSLKKRDRIGEVNNAKCIIRLQGKGVAHDQQFETLVHECLHALDYLTQSGLTEEQIGRLSPALTAMLLDNDWLK